MDAGRRRSENGDEIRRGQKQEKRVFIDFFYGEEKGFMGKWFNTDLPIEGQSSCDEEHLLDDVHTRYISRTCSIDSTRSFSRNASMESQDFAFFNEPEKEHEVALRVPVCCEKCRNLIKTLSQLEGVTSVMTDPKTEKVVVTGTAHPHYVLEQCKKLFSQTTMWAPEDTDYLKRVILKESEPIFKLCLE